MIDSWTTFGRNSLLRLIFLISFALMLLFSVGFAQEQFSISVSEPQSVLAGKTTEFTLSITSQVEEWYSVAVIGTQPSWVSIEKFSVRVPAGSTDTIKVSISPSYDALQGIYGFTVIVSDTSGNKQEKNVLISVIQKLSAVVKDIKLSCTSCKPGETLTVRATAENIGSKNLEDLQLVMSVGEDTKSASIAVLDALTKKRVSEDFVMPEAMQPGKYSVKFQLVDKELLDERSVGFTVPEISDVNIEEKVSSSIFGKSVTLTATNIGNVKAQAAIKAIVSKDWFVIYSGPQPSSKNGEYVWTAELDPKEVVKIEYSELYWPTYIIAAILVAAGIFLYLQMTALSIKKRVFQKHAVEGKEISVSLEIKNRGVTAENVVIKDKVPTMFEIVGKFETLKPIIRKSENESELTWKLGRLKPGEERVLHYKIKTIVGVIGSIALPKASLSGKVGNKAVLRESNYVYLHGIKEK